MDIEMLGTRIERAYIELYNRTRDYRKFSERVARKEHDIEIEKSRLYDEGLINGRNAETRDAQVKLNLLEEFEELDMLKQMEEQSKRQLELASIEVEMLRALLRVEEVIAQKLSGKENK